MSDLPPPDERPVSHGSTAEHFRDVPTPRLVDEVRRLWDQPDEEAAAAGVRGEYTVDSFLVALHERADRSVYDAAVALMNEGTVDAKCQGLRILQELGHPEKRPVFPEVAEVLEAMAGVETDEDVLDALIYCFAWSCGARSLATTLRFVAHSSATVRSAAASNLLFGETFADFDPAAVTAVIALADDEDERVRLDAMWDISQFFPISDARVREVVERRLADPHERVRELAEEALGLSDAP